MKKLSKHVVKKLVDPAAIHAYYQKIIRCLPNNVYWLDRDCITLGCNDNVLKLVGLKSPEDFVGITYEQMGEYAGWKEGQAESFKYDDMEVMETGIGKYNVEEPPLYDAQNRPVYYISSRVPLFDEQKNVIGVVGISVDITERKEMEEQLRIAKEAAEEANRAKTVFLANISHDVKTPLAGIIGTAEYLVQQSKDIVYKNRAESIVHSGIRLLELMSELIELSRMESGETQNKLVRFSLQQLVDDIEQLVKPAIEDKSLSLKVKFDNKIPKYLIGNRSYLYRTILNLVANATKFTSQGGVIIKIELAKNAKKTVVIKVSIKDTGIGIPEDKQSVIFDRFTRLTPSYEGIYKGSGLGLYIVKQFVEEMGGEIYVESEEGVGSTFTFVIPLKKTLLQSDDLTEESYRQKTKNPTGFYPKNFSSEMCDTSKISSGIRVLLVEDNAIAAQTTQDTLRALGCEVDIANSGKIALRLFKSGEYDLIFMDLGLPDINGSELTKKIRKLEEKSGQKTAIFALSAHIDENIKVICENSDMDDVFAKPLLRNHAIEILTAWINKTSTKDMICIKSTSSPESLKVIDLELGALIIGTDIDGAKEALKLFIESLPTAQTEIDAGYKNRNIEKLIQIIHKMHSGLCYCGAPRLKELVKSFESSLRSGDISNLDIFYKEIKHEIKKLITAYADELY